jgi:hypothetical protein
LACFFSGVCTAQRIPNPAPTAATPAVFSQFLLLIEELFMWGSLWVEEQRPVVNSAGAIIRNAL